MLYAFFSHGTMYIHGTMQIWPLWVGFIYLWVGTERNIIKERTPYFPEIHLQAFSGALHSIYRDTDIRRQIHTLLTRRVNWE